MDLNNDGILRILELTLYPFYSLAFLRQVVEWTTIKVNEFYQVGCFSFTAFVHTTVADKPLAVIFLIFHNTHAPLQRLLQRKDDCKVR